MFTPYVILFNVSLVLIVLQVLLALFIFGGYRKIPRRFSQPLGSSMNPAELLAKFSRVHGSINLKVNANIDRPARSEFDTLYVNQRWVYSPGLFANYYTLWQILLMHPKLQWLNGITIWQRVLFLGQIGFTLIALKLGINWLIVTVIIEVFSFLLALYLYKYEKGVLMDVQDEATDLLDLDKVEQARANRLNSQLASRVFLYPLQLVVNTLEFLLPHFLQKALKIKSIS